MLKCNFVFSGDFVFLLSINLQDNPPAVGELSETTKRLLAPGDLLEPDDDDVLLLQETANQLREDAFVILTHLSGKVVCGFVVSSSLLF